jgi:putative SOS response-associated peptidase YedK
MCGRYVIQHPGLIAKHFDLKGLGAKLDEFPARFNIAPTQGVPVVFVAGEHESAPGKARPRDVAAMRWGLVPSWMKPKEVDAKTGDPSKQVPAGWFNARSETAASKPAFRGAYRYRRCLIPADGFYEWQKINVEPGGTKQPWLIRVAGDAVGGEPFAFAGLYEWWSSPDGSELPTCAILTCEPNALMAALHDRMPVILEPEDYDAWIRGTPDDAHGLMKPFSTDRMYATPVGPAVGNVRNDDPTLVEPVDLPGQGKLFAS